MTNLPRRFLTSMVLISSACGNPLIAQTPDGGPPAQVAVSPPRVELNLSEGETSGVVRVLNLSDKATTISASTVHWDMDENNKVRVLEPTEQSLDQWLVVNPLNFTIPPNEQQTVRFAVRPRIAPMPGEHRAMIYFEQQPDPGEPGPGMTIRYRLGVAVYALSGQIHRRGRMLALRTLDSGENLILELDVISEGNANVRPKGHFGIWPASEFPGAAAASESFEDGLDGTYALPELPVLPGYQRTISILVPRPTEPGEYVVYLEGALAERKFSDSIPVSIP